MNEDKVITIPTGGMDTASMLACKVFAYTDVLSLSSVVDVKVWKEKHDSYYWAGKVA